MGGSDLHGGVTLRLKKELAQRRLPQHGCSERQNLMSTEPYSIQSVLRMAATLARITSLINRSPSYLTRVKRGLPDKTRPSTVQ
jgi:hypothetical protein